MNLHEILTLIGIIGPISYAVGRFDEKRCAQDGTLAIAGVVLVAAVLSAAVAITLRAVALNP